MIKIKFFIIRYCSIIKLFIIKLLGMGFKYLLMLYLSVCVLNTMEFGMFSLYLVILNFVYLLVGLGVIDTGMYLISKDDRDDLNGSLFILVMIIAILFSIILYFVLKYYKFKYSLIISILSLGYVINLYVKKISIAKYNKFIMYYSELIMYFVIFVLIVIFGRDIFSSLLIYSFSMMSISLIFVILLRVNFKNIINNIKYIIIYVKRYGIKVQLSQFIAMGTYDLDKVMIKHMYGFTNVGVYSLSLNFIMPVKLFSMSISEIMFRDFAKNDYINKELFVINTVFSIVVSIILSGIAYYIVNNFYSCAYYEMFKYLYLMPILGFLSSAYVPINNFFSAKGLGKQKFINAIVLAVFNIILNFLFIPIYKISGAIYATIIALIINNIMFIYQYRKFINN